jgi:AraC family transcriptional regulator
MNHEPAFQRKTAFKIVGVERYTANGIPSIREAWAEFGKRSEEIKHVAGPATIGIEDYSRDFDMNNGGFPKYYYIASYEVTELADIPGGMTSKHIPSANYAVFTYQGPIVGLHDFFEYIYEKWLPASGYSMDPNLSLDFERYPEPMMDMDNAQIEIWVPVTQ